MLSTICSSMFWVVMLLGIVTGSVSEMSYIIFRSDRTWLKKINYDAALVCVLFSAFLFVLPLLMVFAKQFDDTMALQTKIVALSFLVGGFIGCLLIDNGFSKMLKRTPPHFKILRRLPIM